MIKLTHHEMPVNKTLHHRTIEILTVLTLLIGSPSFLIYFYCSHDTNNPLCQWLQQLPKPVALFCCDDAHALFISETCKMTNISVPEKSVYKTVDMKKIFNDKVSNIFAYGKYMFPRWKYTTLQVPTQGM